MNREVILDYVKSKYDTKPEYLWSRSPKHAVLRHKDNLKWYAVIMNISKEKLGLKEKEMVDVINVKCEPYLIGTLLVNEGYFKAYHMNKTNWISIILDGTVKEKEIKDLIDMSFIMTLK